MNIAKKDVITLSNNNKYVVAACAKYNNVDYFYLMNISNIADVRFMYLDDDKLCTLNDDTVLKELVPLFLEN